MSEIAPFFAALGIDVVDSAAISSLSRATGIPADRLRFYAKRDLVPTGEDLNAITRTVGISETRLRLGMGQIDRTLAKRLSAYASDIERILTRSNEGNDTVNRSRSPELPLPVLKTDLGVLYQADCMDVLSAIDSESLEVVFADPPFNLNKLYPSSIDDDLKAEQYLDWCEDWLRECVRLLTPGGSLFVWNLPRWNTYLAGYLNKHLVFRNWIAVDIKYRLPIQGRLYPSHYSLLYYVKGDRPRVFHPDRLPMPTCPRCYGDLRDYGGYKNRMNPAGVNQSDVWTDIPPVRHAKYKRRNGANELSLKLLDRVIEMSSDPGDTILDPFGGSGTTYMAAELKSRRWIGCEIGPCEDIKERFTNIERDREILEGFRSGLNALFPAQVQKKRVEAGLWTAESVRGNDTGHQADLFDKAR